MRDCGPAASALGNGYNSAASCIKSFSWVICFSAVSSRRSRQGGGGRSAPNASSYGKGLDKMWSQLKPSVKARAEYYKKRPKPDEGGTWQAGWTYWPWESGCRA